MQHFEPASATAAPEVSAPTVELPDENTFVLPPALRRRVHPRRDGIVGRAAVVDADAPQQLRQRISAVRGDINQILELRQTDPNLALAARTYLSRDDATSATADVSPLGAAAALMVTARYTSPYEYEQREALRPFVDAWVAEHGVVFAAQAVVEFVSLRWGYTQPEQQVYLRRQPKVGRLELTELARDGLARMRAVLASASDADYQAAVDALADYRSIPFQRVVVSFLVPTRTDWVSEDCGIASMLSTDALELLLCSVNSFAQLSRFVDHLDPKKVLEHPEAVWTVADAVGPDVTRLLAWWSGNVWGNAQHKPMLAVLAAIPTDEAFALLLNRGYDNYARKILVDALKRFPVRGLRLLAAASANPEYHQENWVGEMLRTHVLGNLELVAAVLPTLSDDQRNIIEPIITQAAPSASEAPAELLPPVLVSPPWTVRQQASKKAVFTDLVAPTEASVDWQPGEQQEWANSASRFDLERPERWGDRDWPTLAERFAARTLAAPDSFVLQAPGEIVRPLLPAWQPSPYWAYGWARPAAARFELDVLPTILAAAREQPEECARYLMPFVSAEVATLMTDWFTRRKKLRPLTLAWFERHPRAAARCLIPAALGKRGKQRSTAEHLLHTIAAADAEAVRDAARTFGPAVVEAIEALLNVDPLHLLPARVPALPAWLEVAVLPQILVRDREHALPRSAVEHLCTMLAMSTPDAVYAGIPIVKQACDPDSLAEFAWALLNAWHGAGAPAKDGWVLDAQGWLGNDDTARRLLSWQGLVSHASTLRALDALVAIGTETALRKLHEVAERRDSTADLRQQAHEKINKVARGLGLTLDQLADRLVPNLGLDADGSLVLDYGRRRFVVGFDEQLNPHVTDEAGERRKSLPKPGVRDDQDLAPAAYARFTELKKAVRKLVKEQLGRLEHAMLAERRWNAAEFRTWLVDHPLLRHVVRRLVWISCDDKGQPRQAFRVAEDRTFADVDDNTVHLADDDLVGIAHPLHLGEAVSAWAEVFADYEILQPFVQLGREVHHLTDEERFANNLARFEGLSVRTVRILGMDRRGWELDDAGFNRPQTYLSRDLPGNRTVVVDLDPGVLRGELEQTPEQRLERVRLLGPADDAWPAPDADGPAFGALGPILASEVLRDLIELTAWSK